MRRLTAFARAELNTLVELEQAANHTVDPSRAAAYLRHGADEARHARMFHGHARRLAREAGLPGPAMPTTDTSRLFETLGEVDFLAFVHRGEARGRAQFEAHRDHFAKPDPKGAKLFEAILADEAQHEAYSGALLEQLTDQARSRRRAMALWELWTTIRRLQRSTASGLFTLALFGLIPLFWSLGFWTRRVRPERRGWLPGSD